MAGGESKLADHDLALHELEKVGLCISYLNSVTCLVLVFRVLNFHLNFRVSFRK